MSGTVCAFKFNSGFICRAPREHPVHYGAYNKGRPGWEPDHNFIELERRRGIERRMPGTHGLVTDSEAPA